MSRHDEERLRDVLDAAAAIGEHLTRGDLDDGLVFDAVRLRLIEIGEAVKGVSGDLLALDPGVPWVDVARMRDHLTHRYFDTSHAIVRATVVTDVPLLVSAVKRLLDRLGSG